MSLVIDTNVPIVANWSIGEGSDSCKGNCIDALMRARGERVLVDDGYRIFDEYRSYLSHAGQPGVGDAFFKWLWDNQANPECCRQVAITPMHDDGPTFEEFPQHVRLQRFDRSDRKFVAVALASGENPLILNATDTDWWESLDALQECGVLIEFLCPDLMMRERDR